MPSIQKLGQLHLCKSRQSAEYEYPSRYRVYILSNSQAVDQILFSFKAYGSNLIWACEGRAHTPWYMVMSAIGI